MRCNKLNGWMSLRLAGGLLLLSVSFFSDLGLKASWATSSDILIVTIKGQVEVRTGAQVSWVKAQKGRRLQGGDVIRTGVRSLAVVEYASTKIQLYENTILEFPRSSAVPKVSDDEVDYASIFMRKGRSLIQVFKGKLKRRFEVITPSLIAGVKGTMFKVFEEEGLKGVAVSEGLVEVINVEQRDEIVELAANHFTLMKGDHLSLAAELKDDHPMMLEKDYFKRRNEHRRIRTSQPKPPKLKFRSVFKKDLLRTERAIETVSQITIPIQVDLPAERIRDSAREQKELTRQDQVEIRSHIRDEHLEIANDIREERVEIANDIREERVEIANDIREERVEIANDIREERVEISSDIRAERAEIADDIREENNDIVADLDQEQKDLKRNLRADLLEWMKEIKKKRKKRRGHKDRDHDRD